MNARLGSLALIVTAACTVYKVPEDGDSDSSGASTSNGEPTTGGTSTTTTTTTTTGDPSTTSTSTTTTTSGDPSTTSTTTSTTTGDPPPLDCDFPTSIQPIFSDRCGCHLNAMPPKGLKLGPGESFDNLVGVASTSDPNIPRVDPNNAAGSFLVVKLKPNPPIGGQMPEGGMLDPADIALIEAWIDNGAPEAGSFPCDGGGAGSVEINEAGPLSVEIGEMIDVDATVLDGQGQPVMGATVKWTSSKEETLYVDAKGTLLGIQPGTVEVTAEADGIVSAPITVEVKVSDPVAVPFADVLSVTSTRCGCHKGDMAPAGLKFDLTPEEIHAALLGPSTQQPDVQRVAKDSPGQSYLFQKLTRSAPATGAQMPKGNAPLEAEKVQPFLRWILNGAPS